ncbi:MAG: hypothetical protein R3B09_14880 [Nannocystaceae bacterium]
MSIDPAALDALPAWLLFAALPLVLATCTAFTKVSVVLSALRIALGAEVLLPWTAIAALSLVLTAVVMAPVALMVAAGYQATGGVGPEIFDPLLQFLVRHADGSELRFFADVQSLAADHPLVVIPAFLVTELTEALHMAVVILLPFAVVDLLIAQIFALLGFPGQPLSTVNLPLKVLLFLAIGGWGVVIGGLLDGYVR